MESHDAYNFNWRVGNFINQSSMEGKDHEEEESSLLIFPCLLSNVLVFIGNSNSRTSLFTLLHFHLPTLAHALLSHVPSSRVSELKFKKWMKENNICILFYYWIKIVFLLFWLWWRFLCLISLFHWFTCFIYE